MTKLRPAWIFVKKYPRTSVAHTTYIRSIYRHRIWYVGYCVDFYKVSHLWAKSRLTG